MAKKNNGKSLEQTIRLIQETFKDSKNTQVLPNSKIICESGIEREFDVLIKSTINSFDICIAIECKDYGKKVSIDRIDSFKGKCSTIKEINKMVFVSANGFQSGAIIQAKNFGIDLLTAEQVSLEYINELIPDLSHLHIQITADAQHRISLGSNADLDIEQSKLSYNNSVIEYKTLKEFKIYFLMQKTIELFEQYVDGLVIKHFVKYKDTLDINSRFPVTLGMDFLPQTFYFEDKKLNKIDLTRLEFDVTVNVSKPVSENSARVVKNLDDTVHAHSIKYKINDDIESEIILKPDNNFTFYHTENKETVEYKKLLGYDPKTDKFNKFD
jgi:hypothetical protein